MKKKLLIIVLLAVSGLVKAQTADKKWNIGLHGGLTQYNGDLGQGFYKTNQAAYGFAGVSISTYLARNFDISLFAAKAEVGHIEENGGSFRVSINTASLNLRINFTGPEAIVRPYLYGGAGIILYDKKYRILNSRTDYALPSFGGGFNFRLGETVNLQLQESFFYTNKDNIDREVQENNDGYLFHTLGLTFNLGKKKDSDGDGVADRKDKCPSTPEGVAVDANGCPLDRDKDGIADYKDECPDVAGLEALKGCPDKDGDGITDLNDRCPDIAGLIGLKGCPDADVDGVADIDDKCPDTKPGYKVDDKGCPFDNDKDGIFNEEDRCPDAAGVVSLQGCPDTDGDGVIDIDDKCPAVKGTIANKGCPEISKEDVKKITKIASQIYFETASAKLKKSSLAQLDALVELLKKYEAANLVIEGHTDSNGDDTYNMNLSQKRTESVKTYLMSKGIFESRLTATGYGETKPIADNKTAAGRAKNRRVELRTEY